MRILKSSLWLAALLFVAAAPLRCSANSSGGRGSGVTNLDQPYYKESAKSLLLGQPDFSASLSATLPSNGKMMTYSGTLSKRSGMYRLDRGAAVLFGDAEHGTRVAFPRHRMYLAEQHVSWLQDTWAPALLAQKDETVLTILGSTTLNGHPCIEILAKKAPSKKSGDLNIGDEGAEVHLYAAKDLDGLVISLSVVNYARDMSYQLSGITLSPSSNQSIEFPKQFQLSNLDPTAEDRFLTYFVAAPNQTFTIQGARALIFSVIPLGTKEADLYRWLELSRIGKDGLSEWRRDNGDGTVICWAHADPSIPGFVKRQIIVTFRFDKNLLQNLEISESYLAP